ncbi:diaminopimelate decarboxylase [Chitinimonas sp. BJYL2]|uniref:diaminopimelate decarboxylase n=1 Tax=Chitinimonas sp. BJYL2 TaxID=2976696 RepID=UPI0022B3399A|nr:diaminopimelate decarboxylase [Chitinimonas sp. BJYL2]
MNLTSTAKGLALDGLALADIAAEFGTPCYVYSEAFLSDTFKAYRKAFPDALICYAMKANSNLSVLQTFARLGAGCDIVSAGELARALAAGVPAERIVFSGVGKTADEMRVALQAGIHCFNVESEPELHRLSAVAVELGVKAPVSLRVNPDVDAKTHPYISTGLKDNKFGVAFDQARRVYGLAASLPGLRVIGIDCHIGSQLTEVTPFVDALERLLALIDALATDGIVLEHIDLGGGLGIRYTDETPPDVADYAKPLLARLAGRNLKIVLEPGRSLVGNAGLLLTRVEYVKPGETKHFAIVDAAMNDLMRPALYQAYHDIVEVAPGTGEKHTYDVVGPVCESSDFLGKDRELAVAQGDLLAVLSAGAYGMTMSSNYNTRPRAVEVMVGEGKARVIRRRETLDELLANEKSLLA